MYGAIAASGFSRTFTVRGEHFITTSAAISSVDIWGPAGWQTLGDILGGGTAGLYNFGDRRVHVRFNGAEGTLVSIGSRSIPTQPNRDGTPGIFPVANALGDLRGDFQSLFQYNSPASLPAENVVEGVLGVDGTAGAVSVTDDINGIGAISTGLFGQTDLTDADLGITSPGTQYGLFLVYVKPDANGVGAGIRYHMTGGGTNYEDPAHYVDAVNGSREYDFTWNTTPTVTEYENGAESVGNGWFKAWSIRLTDPTGDDPRLQLEAAGTNAAGEQGNGNSGTALFDYPYFAAFDSEAEALAYAQAATYDNGLI